MWKTHTKPLGLQLFMTVLNRSCTQNCIYYLKRPHNRHKITKIKFKSSNVILEVAIK